MDLFFRLKKLIGEDNLKEAIHELHLLASSDKDLNELMVHEARFNSLSREIRMGTLSSESSGVEKNKIRNALLELITMMEGKGESDLSSIRSDEAKTLLFEASHDKEARIRTISTKDGWQIQTNNKVLFSKGSPRERILWKDALSQLCNEDLLQKLDTSQKYSETFELTKRGFEIADSTPKTYSSRNQKFGLLIDPRDGQEYKTVELCGHVWLAENLNFDAGEGCFYYDNDPINGEKFGRLYTWKAARKACPSGWRLPTKEDYDTLIENFGGSEEAYKALIKDGVSGFNMLFSGIGYPDGDFSGLGRSCSFWMEDEAKEKLEKAFFFYFQKGGSVSWQINEKLHGYSVRCLKK